MSLVDQFQRKHSYLRISVVDMCNLRCVYCMPAQGLQWIASEQLMQAHEIERLAKIFLGLGIRHIRLTGGEPTVRKDIVDIVQKISNLDTSLDISMTTNGLFLEELAEDLYKNGLQRINLSLDSLDSQKFKEITRGGNLAKVLRGIEKATQVGFAPIKLNVVLMQGKNTEEVEDFLHFASDQNLELRFIEYMPFGSRWHQSNAKEDVIALLEPRYTFVPMEKENAHRGPAEMFFVPEKQLRVGFINAVSHRFCDTCNRLRLMADGSLRACLAKEKHPSLLELLRTGHDDHTIATTIQQIVWNKVDGHQCTTEGGSTFEGVMTRIGG